MNSQRRSRDIKIILGVIPTILLGLVIIMGAFSTYKSAERQAAADATADAGAPISAPQTPAPFGTAQGGDSDVSPMEVGYDAVSREGILQQRLLWEVWVGEEFGTQVAVCMTWERYPEYLITDMMQVPELMGVQEFAGYPVSLTPQSVEYFMDSICPAYLGH